jgi:hypothetical protein
MSSFVCDVFDCIICDNSDGSVAGTTTLQSGNIDVAVSEVEVRGGRGNALLCNLHIQRDINIDITDVEWKPEWIAKQLGTSIVTGEKTAWAMPKWYPLVDLDGAESGTALGFKLDEQPLATASGLKIYNSAGTEVEVTTGYTIATDTVTILAAGAKVGDLYEVRTYKYTSSANTQSLNFESDKFPTGVTLVLETVETDENEDNLYKIQYQFPNTIPLGSFQVQTSSEKKASTQNLKMKVVKPSTTTVVGTYLRIPISAS